MAAVTIIGAWWFSRGEGFGPGASVHFPGGPDGVFPWVALQAIFGMILGIDTVSCWYRARANAILQQVTVSPFRLALTTTAASSLMLAPLAVVYTLWPVVGAWRLGEEHLFLPSILLLATAGLPFLMLGIAAGFAARLFSRADLWGLAMGLLVLTPFLAWRGFVAPASDLFTLASARHGVLIPTAMLMEDVLLPCSAALGLLLLAPMGFRRREHLEKGSTVVQMPSRFAEVARLARAGALGFGLVGCALLGAPLMRLAPSLLAYEVPLGRNRAVSLPQTDTIPPSVLQRTIRIDPDADTPVVVDLELHSEGKGAFLLGFGQALEVHRIEGPTSIASERIAGLDAVLVTPHEPAAGDTLRLQIHLRPATKALRQWRLAWHPRFARFNHLGSWWGEIGFTTTGGEVLWTQQPAPFRLELPTGVSTMWQVADLQATDAGVIESTRPRTLRGLTGTQSINLTNRPGPISLSARVVDPRGTSVPQFLRLYDSELRRLARAFPRELNIALYELPGLDPTDPFALASSTIDQLPLLLPRLDDYEAPTRPRLVQLFRPIHREIVRVAHEQRFTRIEAPTLLRTGLTEYLHEFAYNQGDHGRLTTETRRDLAFVPWRAPGRTRRPFDLGPAEVARWSLPFNALGYQLGDLHRALGFHHMLRGLLGDEGFLRALLQLDALEELSLDDYRKAAEAVHGATLDWFFAQWLSGSAMPDLAIVEGDALLLPDPATRSLVYRVRVEVANRGTGRMPIPWQIQTEGEAITGIVWLDAGERRTVETTLFDRPLVFELDPDGWVAQMVPVGTRGIPEKSRLFFRTIRELR
jgi:hypothetical protein